MLFALPGRTGSGRQAETQETNLQQNCGGRQDDPFHIIPDLFGEWNSDDELIRDQLSALANSLNFDHFDRATPMAGGDVQPFHPAIL
jgi:hypothetical protein